MLCTDGSAVSDGNSTVSTVTFAIEYTDNVSGEVDFTIMTGDGMDQNKNKNMTGTRSRILASVTI